MSTIKLQRYCFFFMVLMVNLFNYSENIILKLITNLSVLLFVAVVFFTSKGRLKMSPAFKYLFIFLLFCILSIPFSTAMDDSINKIGTLAVLFLELMAVYQYTTKEGELDKVLFIIAVCTTVTAIYIVAQGFTALQTVRRVGHITGDSNQVSAYLVYGLVILIFMFFQKRMARWITLTGIATSFLAIVLQGSRTAIVVAGAVSVLEIVLLMKYERAPISKRLWMTILVSILMVAAVYYIMTNPTLYMTLGRRIMSFYQIQTTGQSDMNELSTFNRMTAYRFAIERFLENPLIGKGIGSFASFSEQSVLRRYGFCPNNYLELLQGIGFFGTLFFYLSYFYVYRNSKISFKKRESDVVVLAIMIIIAMLLEHITVVFYYHKLEYLFLGVLFACCYHCKERGSSNEKSRYNDFSPV